ncbi:papilin-like [Drosophila subpulchrella]|uniref:papilin-like n=1 Tax=Drosophila subpulchrella TaxID=1486046 RepID=UPI0018A18B3E|nr:papilin-like [Drosophila subpulchrella]
MDFQLDGRRYPEDLDWLLSEWSGCEACDQETETRTAICADKDGKVYPQQLCQLAVPELSRPCSSLKVQTKWFSSGWSTCSATCGKGIQTRLVICEQLNGQTMTPQGHYMCDPSSKPAYQQECVGECSYVDKEDSTTEGSPEWSKNMCELNSETGNCSNYMIYYYYHAETQTCDPFYYGGCGGNGNRFATLESCLMHCNPNVLSTSRPNLAPPTPSLDQCEQPADAGECSEWVLKWSYNSTEDRCQQFYYGGCGGNDNRFGSEEECSSRCKHGAVEELPEREPLPAINPNSSDTSSLEPTPPTPTQATDQCEQPADAGECGEWVLKWNYNSTEGRCKAFYYGGCGGNDNRFGSEEECSSRCEQGAVEEQQEQGPLPESSPNYFDTTITNLEVTTPTPTPTPTPDVSPAVDQCEQPADAGECGEWGLKWHYNSTEGRCQQFYYGGCGGNDNRFGSEEECSSRCAQRAVEEQQQQEPLPESSPNYFDTTITNLEVPTPTPTPTPDVSPAVDLCEQPADAGECGVWGLNWHYNSTEGRCQQFYYGGCGGNDNRFGSEEECSARCEQRAVVEHQEQLPGNSSYSSDTSKCFLASEPGNCFKDEIRWYYNSQLGLCDEFVYTGCGGNANNYASEEECQNECHDAQTACGLPPVQGRCSDLSMRWFFDEPSGGCHKFEFTGCRGNRNNFQSENECLGFCRNQEVEFAELPPPAPIYSQCNAPPEAGGCDDHISAWFYDKKFKVCTIFTYSGCGGNGNRFETREKCEKLCRNVPELVDVQAELKLDWKNSYTSGSNISMSCSVQGYPKPNVTWTKDNVALYHSERIQIKSQPNSLVLKSVTPDDSGNYICTANNGFTEASAEADVFIPSDVQVPLGCTDIPFFSNCHMVVQNFHCNNPYFKNSCCRSCTLAGQIAHR